MSVFDKSTGLYTAAVRQMAASLAVEWAKKGIRVNSLSPGYMRTKMTGSVLEQDKDLIVRNDISRVDTLSIDFYLHRNLLSGNMGSFDSDG